MQKKILYKKAGLTENYRLNRTFAGNSLVRTPHPFSLLKVLKNGQSVLGYM